MALVQSKIMVNGAGMYKQVTERNDGFIPLDYLFERNFKTPLRQRNPAFYDTISSMNMEEFVQHMMGFRQSLDAITLFRAEYAEAEKSIRRRESVHWKEELAVLSYAMNYPAKHLSAEDMLRLKTVLMPLISIVIAFVPQGSCRELLALHDAGVLSVIAVDKDSHVEPDEHNKGAIYHHTNGKGEPKTTRYNMFVDAMGQPQFEYDEFPFESLRASGAVSPARLRFRNAEAAAAMLAAQRSDISQDAAGYYWMQVPGIAINDHFQVLDKFGASDNQLYIMAVPHIGGLNPDYSGLDFCERVSQKIAETMFAEAAPLEA